LAEACECGDKQQDCKSWCQVSTGILLHLIGSPFSGLQIGQQRDASEIGLLNSRKRIINED
jgi:hypothetical protein